MIVDCEKLLAYYLEQIRCFTDVAVVGLSGGADSSLSAILCMSALGKDNVYGISMPYNETDVKTFNARSAMLAERIGINHLIRPMRDIADAINTKISVHSEDEISDVNKGNSRSRARMCVLYGISHTIATKLEGKRVRVIGTGNLSEDFIGYDTKGGDALADFFPIGELFKSEVYQFLEYFRDQGIITEDHIDRTPSAGLEDGQTDEGDLGYTYNNMEQGIRFCMDHYEQMGDQHLDEVTHFVWSRHQSQRHKHQAPPVIRVRSFCN